MMSTKKASLGLIKINSFWNKGYEVHDVTNKMSSCDLNYIMDVVMWPKFGNSSISMREVIANRVKVIANRVKVSLVLTSSFN